MFTLKTMQATMRTDFLGSSDISLCNRIVTEVDDGLQTFLDARRNILKIARRMLKDPNHAEDIVQDVWLRWQSTDRSVIFDPPAFLTTMTKRMCINLSQSARSRRESSVGSWLSEPVAGGRAPDQNIQRKDALRAGIRLLLESLRPREQAAYILKEAFDYSSHQIAGIMDTSDANVRQMLTRARKRIAKVYKNRRILEEEPAIVSELVTAVENEDLAALEDLLSPDEENRVGGTSSITDKARAQICRKKTHGNAPVPSGERRIEPVPQPGEGRPDEVSVEEDYTDHSRWVPGIFFGIITDQSGNLVAHDL
ncbi:MAG: sigma-70 family RNA polymerase sigma factor [Acidobacteriales bacterium]|nr:sigma-70 family RNA polymerase sigma factor [Terriglobales bacterium]